MDDNMHDRVFSKKQVDVKRLRRVDYQFEIEEKINDLIDRFWSAGDKWGQAPLIMPPHIYSLIPQFRFGAKNQKLHDTLEYNLVDFNDFFDYATSDLTKDNSQWQLLDNEILYFQNLPGTIENLAFELEDFHLYVGGVCLSRHENNVGVMVIFIRKGKCDEDLLENDFCILQYDYRDHSESARSWMSYNVSEEHYEYMTAGVYINYYMRQYLMEPNRFSREIEMTTQYNQLVRETEKQRIGLPFLYDMSRLMVHLPAYLEFMYDLIVAERKPVIYKRQIQHKRGKSKFISKPARYRIVKSIRLIYPNSEVIPSPTVDRKWNSPSYRFKVRGFWRHFRMKPDTVGHDILGNKIVGKTWIPEFEKGTDKEAIGEETVSSNPGTPINVKQTLSYARDVIEAYESQQAGMDTETTKPTEEWIYQERHKLTAALRFLIFKRDNFKCRYCGRTQPDGVKLQIDHLKPVSKWGRTIESNLVTACGECNLGKRAQILN